VCKFRTFKYHMEKWLRLLLDWDPKRRGRKSADSELLVFSMLTSILAKKAICTKSFSLEKYLMHYLSPQIVPVFCVPTNQALSYEIDDTTELHTLQQWICRDTGLAVTSQELLFPRGVAPDSSLPADQCCQGNVSFSLSSIQICWI